MDDAPRIVLAKLGLDGHDRGLKVVARILRDAGMEVVYLGLRQSPEGVAGVAQQEDADAVGISMHNASHLTLGPAMVDALRTLGLSTPVVVGGIVPPDDVATLLDSFQVRTHCAAVLPPTTRKVAASCCCDAARPRARARCTTT